ncbi:MAG TPA: LuxR C-terminal-related transcriptional regulator [Pseudonocardiaceae bacterium]|nr:LuxR C-terminal-related transcriptional regulator [Pseudonocardiaceae bacterium]
MTSAHGEHARGSTDAVGAPEHALFPARPELVGRAGDLAEILSRLADDAGAVLLSGDAGVGKSVLLDAVAEQRGAEGTRVLRADGVEFETDVSFAGLNQILVPIIDLAESLSPTYRRALDTALGFSEGTAPSRLVISNGALALLLAAAAEQALLLIIDDLPWIDRASAGVLGFVARRLRGTRIGFLAASRTGSESMFDRGGLTEFQLRPLDDDAATELLTSRHPGLATRVRQRLLSEAGGNPLALVELPVALNGAQRAALEELPPVLPLTQRLQALFGSRIADLPAPGRELLLLTALDGSGSLTVLKTAAGITGHDEGLTDLAPAERAGLVKVDEGRRRVSFGHPLIRSAVVELSTVAERRAAHTALAGALTDAPDRRAWHLAEASLGPDEDVAVLLEQAARRVLRRGDAVGAVGLLTKAAELSPRASGRGRRLAEAAYIGAEGAGELTSASELLAGSRLADPDGTGNVYAAIAAVYLLINDDCDIDTAHRLLVGAIDVAYRTGAPEAEIVDALHALLLVCWYGGRVSLWDSYYAALLRLRIEPPPVLALVTKTFPDPVRTGKSALGEIDRIIESVGPDIDPGQLVRICTASVYLDRIGDLRGRLWRLVRQGREGGPVRRHIGALMHLSMEDYLSGDWDQAARLTEEGLALCADAGYRFYRWYFQYTQILLAGARGEAPAGYALAEQVIQWAEPRGVGGAVIFANQARTLVCLGDGQWEGAYQCAIRVTPAGALASHVPHALWGLFDWVEAAVRTGRMDEAAAQVRAMREADVAALSPRYAMLVAASAALCAEDDAEALAFFAEARAVPGVARWPFDLARVRLAYGQRLRRARASTEARIPLQAALATFNVLNARPWAERARDELRATGHAVSGVEAEMLTPQELTIARLVASGLTNKQVAERMFLSHRTVGAHLGQIFRKLGITSRSALRDALDGIA